MAWNNAALMLTKDGARKLAYKEPWLYHVVWKSDARARETIASDGLASGQMRHRWHPLFEPRPGHVYLATRSYLEGAAWWMRSRSVDDMYAVKTSALAPGRLNPDEDHFSCSSAVACDRFNLPRPADLGLWNIFGAEIVPSFGSWADQVGLGSDPTHTAYSAARGSLAYCGVVPPKALRRWDGTARRWIHGSDANGEQADR